MARDGSIVWVTSHWTLRREPGFPATVIEVDHDITDLKLATEALNDSRTLAMNTVGGEPAWAFLRKPYRSSDLVKLLQDALVS